MQGEEPFGMRELVVTGVEPASRGGTRPIDQRCGVSEVRRGDRQRAERWEDDEIDLIVIGGDVEHEALLDEQGEGVHADGERRARRVGQGAGDPCWEHDDAVGAGSDGLADGGVVSDPTVEEDLALDGDRREHRRDRGGREDRWDRVAMDEDDLGAGDDVRGDDLDRDRCLLEAIEGEVVADQAMQPVGSAERGPCAEESEELAVRREREDVVSTQTAPHIGEPVEGLVGEAVAGDVGGVEGTG